MFNTLSHLSIRTALANPFRETVSVTEALVYVEVIWCKRRSGIYKKGKQLIFFKRLKW